MEAKTKVQPLAIHKLVIKKGNFGSSGHPCLWLLKYLDGSKRPAMPNEYIYTYDLKFSDLWEEIKFYVEHDDWKVVFEN